MPLLRDPCVLAQSVLRAGVPVAASSQHGLATAAGGVSRHEPWPMRAPGAAGVPRNTRISPFVSHLS